MEIKQLEIKVASACIYSYAIQRRKTLLVKDGFGFWGERCMILALS